MTLDQLSTPTNARDRDDAETRARFYTRTGWLNSYALACGYQERHAHPSGVVTWLELDGGALHVRQHDHGSDDRAGHGRILWASFDYNPAELARARALFLRACLAVEACTLAQLDRWAELAAELTAEYNPDAVDHLAPRASAAIARGDHPNAGARLVADVEPDGGTWMTWADGSRTYSAPAELVSA